MRRDEDDDDGGGVRRFVGVRDLGRIFGLRLRIRSFLFELAAICLHCLQSPCILELLGFCLHCLHSACILLALLAFDCHVQSSSILSSSLRPDFVHSFSRHTLLPTDTRCFLCGGGVADNERFLLFTMIAVDFFKVCPLLAANFSASRF